MKNVMISLMCIVGIGAFAHAQGNSGSMILSVAGVVSSKVESGNQNKDKMAYPHFLNA